MKDDFLTPEEVRSLGLASVGRGVLISRHALLFGPERISIGDRTRIDAFAILSAGAAGLVIGRYVHVGAYTSFLGQARIEVGDFVSLSPRCSIFSSNDDFSGETMAGPAVPEMYRAVVHEPVAIGSHAMLGTGVIVLPGVRVGESSAAGAGSLVKEDVPPRSIVAGVPARFIGDRRAGHLKLARSLLATEGQDDDARNC